jgi:hypothetical protein
MSLDIYAWLAWPCHQLSKRMVATLMGPGADRTIEEHCPKLC